MEKNGTVTIILRAAMVIFLAGLVSLSVWTVRSIADATVQRALQNAATESVSKDISRIETDGKERKATIDALKLYVATSSKDIEQIRTDITEIKIRLGKIEDRLPLSMTTVALP